MAQRMGKRRLALLGGLYVLVSVLGVTLAYSVAYAGNWTTTDGSFKAGDSNVYFHNCDLDPEGNTHRAFHANDEGDIAPTNIRTTLVHGCDTQDVRID